MSTKSKYIPVECCDTCCTTMAAHVRHRKPGVCLWVKTFNCFQRSQSIIASTDVQIPLQCCCSQSTANTHVIKSNEKANSNYVRTTSNYYFWCTRITLWVWAPSVDIRIWCLKTVLALKKFKKIITAVDNNIGTVEPAMSSHIMSSQHPMGGHLAIPQKGILYTNEPPMSSRLHQKATFPVSQGWLVIAGSTVFKWSKNLKCYQIEQNPSVFMIYTEIFQHCEG